MKQLLFVFDHTPYKTEKAQELLDLAYSQAAFGHVVSMLFVSDGVGCLIDKPESDNQPSLIKQLSAWELYDIEGLFYLESTHEIAPDLEKHVKKLGSKDIPGFIGLFDSVISL